MGKSQGKTEKKRDSNVKRGRKSKCNREILDKSWEYLDIWMSLGDMIPSNEALQDHIDICNATLYNWRSDDDKDKDKKEFQIILEKIKRLQYKVLINKGLNNEFNSNIVKLALGKHGLSDKKELTGEDGGPIEFKKVEIEFVDT